MQCECEDNTIDKKPKFRVIDKKHRVGANVKIQNTILSTLDQDGARGCNCVQFFLGNRQSYNCRTIDIEDKRKTLEYCNKYNKSFYIHCPYVANLSKDTESSILNKSINIINKEIVQISGLPAGCILHIGSKGSIQNVINNINDMDIPRGVHSRGEKQLILENAAGQGSSIGRSWEELRKIYEGLDLNTVGLCIDTQHLFGAGVNNLSNHEDIVKLFDISEEVYGKYPDVIHLNDSKVDFNENKDRHENIGAGFIWNQEKEGLKSLLDFCYNESIDVILETPDSSNDLDNIYQNYMDLQTIDLYKNTI